MPSTKAKLLPQPVGPCGHLWKKLMPSANAVRGDCTALKTSKRLL